MRIIPLSSIQSVRNQQQHYPERTGNRLRKERYCDRFGREEQVGSLPRQPPTSRSPAMLMVCARASSNVIWQNSDLQRAGIIVVAELLSWLCLQTRFRQILEGARIVDRLVAELLQRFSGKCRAPA